MITNPSSNIVFFVRFRLLYRSSDILPIIWSDNFISFVPGEIRSIDATFSIDNFDSTQIKLVVENYNT